LEGEEIERDEWNTRPIEDALQAKLVTAEYIAVDYRNEWANVCEQRDALRAELDGMNKMIASSPLEDALIKERDEWKSAHDNLANQLSIANDTVEIAYEGLRELENQGFHLYVPDVTEIAQDYLRRIEKGGLPELRAQLGIAVDALNWAVLFFEDSDHEFDEITRVFRDALAEIEKEGKGAS
jgi:hypothetical protein